MRKAGSRGPSIGLELSCLAKAGGCSLLYGTPAGQTSTTEGPARRVSFSELLARSERSKRGRPCRTTRVLVSTGMPLLLPSPARNVETYNACQHGEEEEGIPRLKRVIQDQGND